MKRVIFINYMDFIVKVELDKVSQRFFYELDVLYENFRKAENLLNKEKMYQVAESISHLILKDSDLNLKLSYIEKEHFKVNDLGNIHLNERNENKNKIDYNELIRDIDTENLSMILLHINENHIDENIKFIKSKESDKIFKDDLVFLTSLAKFLYFVIKIEKRVVLKKFKPS